MFTNLHVCIYVYIYIHVCVYIYVYIYICIYIYIYTCMYMYVFMYVYIYIHFIFAHVYLFLCNYMCMYMHCGRFHRQTKTISTDAFPEDEFRPEDVTNVSCQQDFCEPWATHKRPFCQCSSLVGCI